MYLVDKVGDMTYLFEQHCNKLLQDLFDGHNLSSLKNKLYNDHGFPKMDVFYTKDHYCVEALVPCEEKDVSVEIKEKEGQRFVVISGQMSQQQEQSDAKFISRELRRSKFSRTMLLPTEIQGDPEATIKNGVLSLKWKLPEVIEQTQTRLIPITKQ